jgi:hypothetical protein
MNTALPAAPFKPVTKGDAAELLGVSTKTVDNYIKAGLLPPPRPFGGRELWHPDIFFACLRDALMPSVSGSAGANEVEPPGTRTAGARHQTGRESGRSSSPLVRQKHRQAELLGRLNGDEGS